MKEKNKNIIKKASVCLLAIVLLCTTIVSSDLGTKKFHPMKDSYSIKWQGYTDDGIGNGIISDSNSNIYTVGNEVDYVNENVNPYIAKYDRNGTLLWENQTLSSAAVASIEAADEGYNPSPTIAVSREACLEVLQKVSQRKNLGDLLSGDYVVAVTYIDTVIDNDGNIIAIGFYANITETTITSKVILAKFSPDGDMIWQRLYNYRIIDFGWSVTIDPRTNIIYICVSSYGLDINANLVSDIYITAVTTNGVRLITFTPDLESLNGNRIDSSFAVIQFDTYDNRLWIAGSCLGDLDNDTDSWVDEDIFVVEYGVAGLEYHEWQYDAGWPKYEDVRGLIIEENNIFIQGQKADDVGGGFIANGRALFLRFTKSGTLLQSAEKTQIDFFQNIEVRTSKSGQKQIVGAHFKNNKAFVGIYDYNTLQTYMEINDPIIGFEGTINAMIVTPLQDIVVTGYFNDGSRANYYTICYHINEVLIRMESANSDSIITD